MNTDVRWDFQPHPDAIQVVPTRVWTLLCSGQTVGTYTDHGNRAMVAGDILHDDAANRRKVLLVSSQDGFVLCVGQPLLAETADPVALAAASVELHPHGQTGLIASVEKVLKRVEDQIGHQVMPRPWWQRILFPLFGLLLVLAGVAFLATPIPLFVLALVGFPLLFCFHPSVEAGARRRMVAVLGAIRRRVGALRPIPADLPRHSAGQGLVQTARSPVGASQCSAADADTIRQMTTRRWWRRELAQRSQSSIGNGRLRTVHPTPQ